MYAIMADKANFADKNIELFQLSKLTSRTEKKSEDYWYQRNAKECKFNPELLPAKKYSNEANLKSIKGLN